MNCIFHGMCIYISLKVFLKMGLQAATQAGYPKRPPEAQAVSTHWSTRVGGPGGVPEPASGEKS